MKPLLTYKLEVESGAPLHPPKTVPGLVHLGPEAKIQALNKALTLALHQAVKEDQKRLLNIE
jgi:hypothetical protein